MYGDVAVSVDVDVVFYCVNVEPEVLGLLVAVVVDDIDTGTHDASIGAALREGEGGVDCLVVLTS